MRHRGLVMGVALVLLSAAPVLAEDEPWVKFSTSVNYSVGDYGTNKDTKIVYVPFTLGVRPLDRFWLSVTVPFIYQDTQNVVLTGGGVASRKEQKGKLAQPARATTESGLGDVLLKASVVVVEERDLIPEITPYLKIKFPTADKDRGLGTGEFDETLGVDMSKNLVGDLYGYLTLGYTFIGDPRCSELGDSFRCSVGVAFGIVQAVTPFALMHRGTPLST